VGLFGSKQQANLKMTIKLVEEVIAELNLSPVENRLSTEAGEPAWGLMKGSAEVFIFITPGDSEAAYSAIQVLAPLMLVPTTESNRNALFQHLLELNAHDVAGASFGLKGETIVLMSGRSTEDLDRSEIKDLILRVGYYADYYDDELVSQFGGRRYTD
jgi:hypothetical protein